MYMCLLKAAKLLLLLATPFRWRGVIIPMVGNRFKHRQNQRCTLFSLFFFFKSSSFFAMVCTFSVCEVWIEVSAALRGGRVKMGDGKWL